MNAASSKSGVKVAVAVAALACAGLALATPASGDGRLFVGEWDLHQVEVYTPAGELLKQIPTGIGPRGLAVQGGKLFVADEGLERAPGSSLTIIDLQSLAAERTLFLCEACGPRGLAFDAQGVLWVAAAAPPSLIEVRPPYSRRGRTFSVNEGPPGEVAAAADGAFVAGALSGAGRVRLLVGAARRAATLEVGSAPARLASRPGAAEVWATTGPEAGVAVIRVPATGAARADRLAAPAFPQDIAFTPDGGRALVTGARDRVLVLLDSSSGRELSRLTFDSAPQQIAVSPDGRQAAVFLPAEEKIAVVQLTGASLTRGTTFAIPAGVVELLWLP